MKKELNLEELKKYYIDENHSMEECAKYFNISKTTLYRRCKENNIIKGKGHGNNNTPLINKDDFYQYYIIENHTREECQVKFNCSMQAIQTACEAYNIYKSREQINKNISSGRSISLDINQITPLYIKERLSQEEIGDMFNCSPYTVGRCLKENEITREKPNVTAHSNEKRIQTCINKYGSPFPPNFNGSESIPNKQFANLLDLLNINYNKEIPLNNFIYDFKINDKLIEINPTATHNIAWNPYGENKIDKNYHKNKMKNAINNNYSCMMIWDWDNINAIKNYFASQKNKIYARECQIKIINKEESKSLLESYHFQGYAKASITYGLFYNNELVSIMSFDRPRYNHNYEWEIIRYCSSSAVIGGASKLFNTFIKEYNPNSIVSYCDLSKFRGETYKNLGFNIIRTSSPSLHWYNIKTKKHYTDNMIRAYGVSSVLHHCKPEEDEIAIAANTTDNYQLMILNGFLPVYDCGQQTWGWINNK